MANWVLCAAEPSRDLSATTATSALHSSQTLEYGMNRFANEQDFIIWGNTNGTMESVREEHAAASGVNQDPAQLLQFNKKFFLC